ncbi:hypothetical protein QBZ16_002629 [Prototheca wickerhamii]|uniref:U4/U6.U5 small nuclear ribonucleoprotein 27kDa protein domain-containing protein n=1 Tax=Prototheca wickerhamii TaxID=3111 RepID=A0AAD9IKN2_PROWI|nr:hypothetical protein QBZ16_002629 [Prototheca wickerhamii]
MSGTTDPSVLKAAREKCYQVGRVSRHITRSFEGACKPSWVKHFDTLHDKRQRLARTLQTNISRTAASAKEDGAADLSYDAELSPEELQLMAAMGIPMGFDTTQGKHIDDDGANAGAVKIKSTRRTRQYMNRRRTNEKISG